MRIMTIIVTEKKMQCSRGLACHRISADKATIENLKYRGEVYRSNGFKSPPDTQVNSGNPLFGQSRQVVATYMFGLRCLFYIIFIGL